MRQQRGRGFPTHILRFDTCSNAAKRLISPSARSDVPPFMVMDVMAAAARIEAAGGRVIHMEVGQPAAPAPACAIAAARAALAGPLRYTETLGIPSLRARIARHYAERYGVAVDPARIVVTTGSSAGFILAFLALFEPGDRVAVAVPGLSALPAHPQGARLRAGADRDDGGDALGDHAGHADRGASPRAAQGRAGREPGQSDRHHDDRAGARAIFKAPPSARASASSPTRSITASTMRFAADTAARLSENAVVINSFSKYFCMTGWRVGWMVVPDALVRPIDRLQGNLAISVPTLSQIAAEAAFDGRAEMEAVKHGYEENRRILVEGLPKAGLDKFLPVDGAFYLYADVSRFSSDSFDFAKRMLEETHVAATPGVDFDPIDGRHFIRFCYAGSAAEMHEAVERIGKWLRRG